MKRYFVHGHGVTRFPINNHNLNRLRTYRGGERL